jgi:hypothetical protein
MGAQSSRPVTIRLEEDLLARVDERAAAKEWSRNHWISRTLERAVDAETAKAELDRRTEMPASSRQRRIAALDHSPVRDALDEVAGDSPTLQDYLDSDPTASSPLAPPTYEPAPGKVNNPAKLTLKAVQVPGGWIAQALGPEGDIVFKASASNKRDAERALRAKLPAGVELA